MINTSTIIVLTALVILVGAAIVVEIWRWKR